MLDIKLEIYPQDGGGVLGQLDFFNDEHIKLKRSLKKIQELEGIFSEFTYEFSIPASPKNNNILNHYNKIELLQEPPTNPYKGYPASLTLSEVKTIYGDVQIRGATFKDGEPQSYMIAFYGDLVSIKHQLEALMINSYEDIPFPASYNVEYGPTFIKDTWEAVEPDVLMPIAGNSAYYVYVPNEKPVDDEYNPGNIAPQDDATSYAPDPYGGVRWIDISPSFRLKGVVEEVLSQVTYGNGQPYTVNWDSKIDAFLDDAYFTPTVNAGEQFNGVVADSTLFQVHYTGGREAGEDWDRVELDIESYDHANMWDQVLYQEVSKVQGAQSFNLFVQGNANFAGVLVEMALMVIRVDTGIHEEINFTTFTANFLGDFSGSVVFPSHWINVGDIVYLNVRRVGSLARAYLYRVTLTLTKAPALINTGISYIPNQYFPEKTAYEFITGFLKTFNLIMYVDPDNTLNVVDIDSYYKSTEIKDWSKYIDLTAYSMRNLDVPKEITYEFTENPVMPNNFYKQYSSNKDYGTKEVINDVDFGADSQKLTSMFSIFYGTKMYDWPSNYIPTLGSSKIPTIPMHQQYNKDIETVSADFLLFYYSGLVDSDSYRFQNGLDTDGNASFEILQSFPFIQSYYHDPALEGVTNPKKDRNFSYFNEYFFPNVFEYPNGEDIDITNNIYNNFFNEWHQRSYDINSRKVSFKGVLPGGEFKNFEMSDRILIDGTLYVVSEFDYDFLDGTTNMQLVTYDSHYELSTVNAIDRFGKATVSVCKDTICRSPYTAVSAAFLKSNLLKREDGEILATYKQVLIDDQIKNSINPSNTIDGMVWRNIWLPDTTYYKNDTARENDWTSVANTTTTDHIEPLPFGEVIWLYDDAPTWSNQSVTDVIFTGVLITETTESMHMVLKVRAWIPNITADAHYEILSREGTTGPVKTIYKFTGDEVDAVGWYEIVIEQFWVAHGTELYIGLSSQVFSTTTDYNYPWVYTGTSQLNNDPGLGNINRDNQHLILRINNEDNNSVDRSTDLAFVEIGTIIKVVDNADVTKYWQYYVEAVSDETSWYSYTVSLQQVGTGGAPADATLCNVYFEVPVAQSTPYVTLTDHFLDNPKLQGAIQIGTGGAMVLSNDGNGFDIEIQEYLTSPDWDILAYSGNTTSAGGGVSKTTYNGFGRVGEIGNISWTLNLPSANTWTLIDFTTPQEGADNEYFAYNVLTQGLQVNFPVAAGTRIYVDLSINMSLNIQEASLKTIDVTHGINGTPHADVAWEYSQYADTNRLAGSMFPLSYNWKGVVLNGDTINIFMKSSALGTIYGRSRYLTAHGTVVE